MNFRSETTSTLTHLSDSGNVLVELAIVLPLILVLSLVGLEFSRSLKHSQLASTLSREAASVVYRDCTNMGPRDTMTCIDNLREPLERFGGRFISGTQLVVSVYEWSDEGGAEVFRRVGISPRLAATGTITLHATEYSIPGGQTIDGQQGSLEGSIISGNIDAEVVKKHRVIVIGEAFVPFNPIVGGMPGLFSLHNKVFYDSSVV